MTSREAALAHAKAEFPREACGLFHTVDGYDSYFPCRNISNEPDTFIMDPKDYLHASELGAITALFHSHCNLPPSPSDADRAVCEALQLPSVILSLPNEKWETFFPTGFQAPYKGRTWVYGVFDCYSLMRDFYLREFQITLPEFDREGYWWETGKNLYLDNLEPNGFRKIDAKELKRGDIILMQIRSKVPNHVAIYLGQNKILQHLIDRLSAEYIFGGYWAKVTRDFYRHEVLK